MQAEVYTPECCVQAEGEVQALTKQVRGKEEDFESSTNKLLAASEKLEQATKAADDSERSPITSSF